MQKTGTIVAINSTEQGGYNSQNGYIYTFDMTIQCPDGQFTGEIGSKSQVYPKANGQEITVDTSQGPYGPRFKAINPQYAGQQGQPQGGQQQQPPQGQQNQRQQPNQQQKPPDWDEITRGKVRCNIVCAAIQGGQLDARNHTECDSHMRYIFTGQIPNQQAATGGGPNPNYNPNPAPPQPGDDVPF